MPKFRLRHNKAIAKTAINSILLVDFFIVISPKILDRVSLSLVF